MCKTNQKKKLLKSPQPRRPIRDHILGCSLSPFLSRSLSHTDVVDKSWLTYLSESYPRLLLILFMSTCFCLSAIITITFNIFVKKREKSELCKKHPSVPSGTKSQVRPELCPPVTIFKCIHCYLKKGGTRAVSAVCLKIRARMYVKCQQVTQKSILFLTPLPLPRHIFA